MPIIEDHSVSFTEFFNARAKNMKFVYLESEWTNIAPLSPMLTVPDEFKHLHKGVAYGGSYKWDGELHIRKGVWDWAKDQILQIVKEYEDATNLRISKIILE